MGLTQLQRAYKRQLTDLYDADDEDEVTPSRKRQKTTPADGDTRVVVKHRCTGQRVTPTSSQDYYCDSPPANQEAVLPWGPVELLSDSDSESGNDNYILNTPPPHYYNDVDEDAIASSPAHENEDDDAFEFSPASPPPLTQSTQEYMTPTPAPTTLYVFPMKTIVLKPDGGYESIADQHHRRRPSRIRSRRRRRRPRLSLTQSHRRRPSRIRSRRRRRRPRVSLTQRRRPSRTRSRRRRPWRTTTLMKIRERCVFSQCKRT